MKLNVIMPAGGRICGKFAEDSGVEVKALLPVSGKTILDHTLCALRASDLAQKCVLVGPDDIRNHPSAAMADAVLGEGETGPENIFKGLNWLKEANGGRHPDRVLIITTDLPFITAENITSFVNASPPECDICAPIIDREQFSSRFPNAPAEYVRLRDGEWTMGCVFLVNPSALEKSRTLIENVFTVRKSQIGMARMLGLGFILRFLLRKLEVRHIEERCSEIIGCSISGVAGCAPELAFDIDSQDEYNYALDYIKNRGF